MSTQQQRFSSVHFVLCAFLVTFGMLTSVQAASRASRPIEKRSLSLEQFSFGEYIATLNYNRYLSFFIKDGSYEVGITDMYSSLSCSAERKAKMEGNVIKMNNMTCLQGASVNMDLVVDPGSTEVEVVNGKSKVVKFTAVVTSSVSGGDGAYNKFKLKQVKMTFTLVDPDAK